MNKELRSRKVPFICNGGLPLISKKLGRNDPCKCGSGIKSKNCCGNETRYYTKPNNFQKVVVK